MADEKIEVRYKRIGDSMLYHKYIVYTDASGNKFAGRGGPEGGDSSGSDNRQDNDSWAFGAINTEVGVWDEAFIDWDEEDEDQRQTIITDSDLSQEWQDIVDSLYETHINRYQYNPYSQNSNAAVDKALGDAGLPPTTGDGLLGGHYAPGSGVPLSTPNDDSSVCPLPPWAEAPRIGFPASEDVASPLVIDLDGDGVELTEFDSETTSSFFDIDNDGFAEQTAWIAANQDGLLARDINEDGVINSAAELFGSATVDGFAILSALDSNNDLVIDQHDDAWDELVIWKDVDGDAYTDDGELLTLASQDIVSISLSSVAASTQVIEGNPISHTSTVTKTGGSTAAIVDAWFVHDNVNTFYDQDYTLDVRTHFLPTLRGLGKIPDLHVAMSLDEELLDLVHDFYTTFDLANLDDVTSLTTQFEDILFRWAGVDGLSPTGRGDYIDGRKLAFMEAMFDDRWVSNIHGISDPYENATTILLESWDGIYAAYTAQLAFQAGAKVLFDPTTVFNPFLGDFEGDRLLVEQAIVDLVPLASAPGVDSAQYWLNVAKLIKGVKPLDELTIDETAWIEDAISNSTNLIDWDGIKEIIAATPLADSQFGDFYDPDILYGANDVNDTLNGYGGNDLLYGLSGNDILNGGEGDDILYAGDGGDTVYGGNGDDTLTHHL